MGHSVSKYKHFQFPLQKEKLGINKQESLDQFMEIPLKRDNSAGSNQHPYKGPSF